MFSLKNLLLGLAVGGSLVGPAARGFGQATPVDDRQANVSDAALIVFVRAYVDSQELRQKYEPLLRETTDAETSRQIQDQASAELKASLAKHNLTVDDYNRSYTAINNNEELRKKALQLVEQERKKTAAK